MSLAAISTMVTPQPYRIGLIADFNATNLAVALKKEPSVEDCVQAPFGHAARLLVDGAAPFWERPFDAVLVWTLPRAVAPAFRKATSGETFSADELTSQIDSFCSLLATAPQSAGTILVPTWVAPELGRGLGAIDLTRDGGVSHTLMRMNLRLVERFTDEHRIMVLDAQRWLATVGATSYDPRLWYLSKTPFQHAVFQEAARDVIAALDAIHGRTRKIVILDLDHTLWGGTVGEDGWEHLRLGGHDAVGEAFVDFQSRLKALVNRGILLAIVSKNEEATALDAIRRHPEMLLRLDDFVGWKINWHDKAANIAELLTELNLGLESAIFLDDTPFERARVREVLPQVFVPELPVDPMRRPAFLDTLKCFDQAGISAEDRARTPMYVADRQRLGLKEAAHSLDDWLRGLDLRISAELLSEANLERAAQLFNKTNQMNLSTRRMPAAELLAWAAQDRHRVWTFRVRDRFGDYGLCGIGSFVRNGGRAHLIDFLLSCRVMGRRVEETMLHTLADDARRYGCKDLLATYVPTSRNRPCEEWLKSRPGVQLRDSVYRFDLDTLRGAEAVAAQADCQ